MGWARGDRAGGAGVVVGGADRHDFLALAVGGLEVGVLDGARQVARQAVAVEDVVAQHERARLAGDEVLADGEGLRQAVEAQLFGLRQVHAVARAVPE